MFGLAALVQVCAALPNNFIAFEYPVGQPAWWPAAGLVVLHSRRAYAIPSSRTAGSTSTPGLGPGIGIDFNVQPAKAHLQEEDRDFFD